MKSPFRFLLSATLGLLLSMPPLLAQEPAFVSRFTQFDFGKDQKLPFEVSDYIRANKGDEAKLRALAEGVKKAVATSATSDPFFLATEVLNRVGNDSDVPFLAEQLSRKEVFAAAINTLEQINSPAAVKALIAYAGKADDHQQAEILLTLGRMKNAEAVTYVASKTSASNPLVQRAAYGALAGIASPEAIAVLEKTTPSGTNGSAVAVLELARTLAEKGDKTRAAALTSKILKDDSLPQDVKIAAMSLTLSTPLPDAKSLLNQLVTNPQPITRPLVLRNFSQLSPEQQKTIVDEVIRGRDTKEAVQNLRLIGAAFPVSSLLALLESKEPTVQRAAMLTLSRSATKTEFEKLLADYLAGQGDKAVTRMALIALPAKANEWLSESLGNATEPNVQVELIGLLKERLARNADATLLKLISSGAPEVKTAALQALAAMGAPDQADQLLSLLLASTQPTERRDLAKALSLSLRTAPNKTEVIARAAKELSTVQDAASKDAIIDLMGRSGEPACLPVLFAEFAKADKARRTIILRAIANWPDDAPLDQLAIIAASDPELASRVFSLRAYLDILNRAPLTPEVKLQRLWEAFLLAQRPEEHKAIISQAATVPLASTRMLLGSYRFDPAVKAELAAATRAHDLLLEGGKKKPAADEDDTAPKDEPEEAAAKSKKDKYEENPFDHAGNFDKWEDPVGLAGRWTAGDVTLDVVQYPNKTFQALLTTKPGGEHRKVLGLLSEDGTLKLYGLNTSGSLTKAGGELTVDGAKVSLVRTPVGKVDALPRPAGAKVLLDAQSADGLKPNKAIRQSDGSLEIGPGTGSLVSKDNFGSVRAYLEFRMPYNPESLGPRRGNSGVYMQNTYEVQLQDGFGTELSTVGAEPANRFCGSIYGLSAPKVNACAPPLEWQSMVVEFTAPKFDAAGNKTANAVMSVWQNGILIQDKVEVPGATGGDMEAAAKSKPESPNPGIFLLQNHGNRLQFRNIWIEPLS